MQAPGATRHINAAQKSILQDAYLQNLPSRAKPHSRSTAAPKAASTKPTSQKSEFEAMFAEVEREIAEREETLAKLRALGQSGPHEAKLQGEISQRVAELKRINAMILDC